MKISPGHFFGRIKGRTGFMVAIILMLSATLFLSISCTNRAAGTGWQGSISLDPAPDEKLPTGFIVIEMEKAYLYDAETISDTTGEEILGIGPLPADASFASEGIVLKELLPQGENENNDHGDPKVYSDEMEKPDVVLEEMSFDVVAQDQPDEDLPDEDLSDPADVVEVTLEEKTPQWVEHVVKPGDNLTDISRKHGLRPQNIVDANGLNNPDMLREGQLLLIPLSEEDVTLVQLEIERRKAEELEKRNRVVPLKITTYVVADGDSLWSIANTFNLSIDTLFGSNNLKNPDYLKPGLTLRVPNQDGIFYKIKKGDTLSGIAKKYKLDPERINETNPEHDYSSLEVGGEIFIPGASPAASVYSSSSSGTSKSYSRSFRWPVVGKINSPFGWRRHPITKRRSFHTGIDIKAGTGVPIRAAKAGRVAYSGWMGGYGRVVVINHGSGYSTLYAHCSRLMVRKGAKVSSGQVIAKVGSSGRVTGPHLHFEVRSNNKAINPLRVLR